MQFVDTHSEFSHAVRPSRARLLLSSPLDKYTYPGTITTIDPVVEPCVILIELTETPFEIIPECTVSGLVLASAVVWIEMARSPKVSDPMANPLSVMVTAVLTAMNEEDVNVSTIAVAVGAAQFAEMLEPLNVADGKPGGREKPLYD